MSGGFGSGTFGSGTFGSPGAILERPSRTVSDHGRELISEYPSWAQEDPDHIAVADCYARESELIMARARQVRDGMIPTRANELTLPLWEWLFGLPGDGPVEQRRQAVVDAYKASIPDPSGSIWERKVTTVLGLGWSYVEDSAAYTVTITTPWRFDDPRLPVAADRIRAFTPAHLDIELVGSGFFTLDVSGLDNDAMP